MVRASFLTVGLCCYAVLSYVQLFTTPWTVAARLFCPWDSPGKNIGVGSHFLLHEIFRTQRPLMSLALEGGFFTISATWEFLRCSDFQPNIT